ncbi:MAG: outer membrane protein assembly factor BamD [Candidatus Anammoxibacter sp.]
MNKLLVFVFIIPFFLLINNIVTAEKLIWNKESGWVEMEKLTKDTLDQRYRYALALITDQQYIFGIRRLEAIVKDAPDSEFAEPAMINIAHAYFLADDYKEAFKTYETFLRNYPGTRRTGEIMEKQYDLAISQMDGLEVKSAIRMFERIIERNTLGPYAADAQIKIADCYQKLKKYDLAIENYEKTMENYSDSAWVPYAQFQIPICKIEDERRQDRNYGLLTEAEDGFYDYMANNPSGALFENAKRKMLDIKTAKAKREFAVAEFYLRLKKPKSAKIYYEIVENDFPNTVWSAKAGEKLKFLRKIGAIK